MTSSALSSSASSSAVVAGGGLAGLAAATVLAEHGVKVTLFERERYLGGRAGAWSDQLNDGTEFQMERGFHAFFRQYYNLRDLMRRVDPELSCLEEMQDYPIYGPNGAHASFSDLPKRAPLNVLELVRRTDALGVRDLLKVDRLRASAMLSYGAHTYARYDQMSAREYLDSLRFPSDARQLLFDVFSHSFFNAEERLSAAELLMQFHFYFMGNPEGLVFDTMKVPFSRGLFEPLGRYLESKGVTIRTGVAIDQIEHASQYGGQDGGSFVTHAGSEAITSDHVVLALSVPALRQVVARSPSLGTSAWRSHVDALEVTRPFIVWRLWMDSEVDQERPRFAGTAGVGILDNISIYERLEDESRAYTSAHGGSVIELHAYAVDPDLSEDAIREDLLSGLHTLYPETRAMKIVEERYLARRDCPAFAPGSNAKRPGVTTPTRGLTLAGDFVRLDQPSALMERAVTSGFRAANHLLTHDAQEIKSVPKRGVLASLRL